MKKVKTDNSIDIQTGQIYIYENVLFNSTYITDIYLGEEVRDL